VRQQGAISDPGGGKIRMRAAAAEQLAQRPEWRALFRNLPMMGGDIGAEGGKGSQALDGKRGLDAPGLSRSVPCAILISLLLLHGCKGLGGWHRLMQSPRPRSSGAADAFPLTS